MHSETTSGLTLSYGTERAATSSGRSHVEKAAFVEPGAHLLRELDKRVAQLLYNCQQRNKQGDTTKQVVEQKDRKEHPHAVEEEEDDYLCFSFYVACDVVGEEDGDHYTSSRPQWDGHGASKTWGDSMSELKLDQGARQVHATPSEEKSEKMMNLGVHGDLSNRYYRYVTVLIYLSDDLFTGGQTVSLSPAIAS
ncbi:unnamed protein product [Amoebophrya sp. A25]|nr:unnamed protein product [Amoebophrya sp. A25]|eukprot:GSA25T00023763001.1